VALRTQASWQIAVRVSSWCREYSQMRGKRLGRRLEAVTGVAGLSRHAVSTFAFGVFSMKPLEVVLNRAIVRKLSSVSHPADECGNSAKDFYIDVIS
jgi:hypothetical protein